MNVVIRPARRCLLNRGAGLAALPLVLLWPLVAQGRPDAPAPPTRAQSYFGLHFDLHASADIKNAGETVTEELVERLVTEVKPDFIQIDCKGHPGISSYPTKVPDATHVAGFVRDPLEVYRKVTARHGVALYLHYSGVLDQQVVKTRPEWAAVGPNGKPYDRNTSLFSPYVDRVLIPQLQELRNDYGADGVWIDGECWGVQPDYRDDAIAAFRQATGIATVPRSAADPGYRELLEFTRGTFRDYMKHYLEALRETAPGLQVTSNWSFSSRMPEPVDLPIAFLSGDFSPLDSVRVGAYEARCLEPQARSAGLPWDLMDWSFARDWSEKTRSADPKTAVQLCQSAAQVLALGGAYQAYFKQDRDLAFRPVDIPVMAELGHFCRDRQDVCKSQRPVPQVAILYSRAGWHASQTQVYQSAGPKMSALRGVMEALLDSQLSVEILMTHHLRGHVGAYPLVVVPDWAEIEPELKSELMARVREGAKLLLVGPEITQVFRDDLSIELSETPGAGEVGLLGVDGRFAHVTLPGLAAAKIAPDQVKASFFSAQDEDARTSPAALIVPVGKGAVGVILPELGAVYHDRSSPIVRDLFTALSHELLPAPAVTVTGSRDVQVVVATLQGRLQVNLLNTAGPHANNDRPVYAEIPPVGPLQITVPLKEAPRKVRLEPEGIEPQHAWRDGTLTVTVERVPIHSVVVIE